MGTTYSIFNQSLVSATTVTSGPTNVATEFMIDRTCWAVGFVFRRPDTTSQTAPTARLFNQQNNNGASTIWFSVASGTFTLGTTSGWKTVMLATPVKLAYNLTSYRNRYRVSTRATRYCQTTNYWTTGPGSAGLTSGPMAAPSRANAFLNCQSSSGGATDTDVPITASSAGQNWWADVLISDVDPRMNSNMTTLFGGD